MSERTDPMRRRRTMRLTTMLLALALVVAACGGDDGDTTTTAGEAAPDTTEAAAPDTTEAAAPDTTTAEPMACELTVGVMGPFTGEVAFIGQVQLNWFKYALDLWNEESGYDFQMVEADTQFDVAQSATLAQTLLDNSAVLAAVGPAGSDQVDSAGAVFEAGDPNFTFISPSSTRVGITAQYQGLFRTVPSDADQGPTTAAFLLDQGATSVFIVDDQSSYSTGLADIVEEELGAAGITVARESVSQDVTDFSALVGTIADDVNFIYLPWQVAANGQIFANQMAEQGKEAVIFGSDGMDSDEFSTPGSYIAAFAPDIAAVEGSQDLLAGFLEQYEETNTFGPPVFAAARVIFEAADRVCQAGAPLDRAGLQAEIAATDQATSILGSPISFTPDGDLAEGRFFIFQIQEDGTKTLVS